MITEALLHCPGIGPSRLEQLQGLGLKSWMDVVDRAEILIPGQWIAGAVAECQRSVEALRADRIEYFVERLHPKDRWRILEHYLDQVSYFDIETDGLEHDAAITTIACWHGGDVHLFVENENLDDLPRSVG